jgi:hypothetical protein
MKAIIILLICITTIFAQGKIGGGDHDKIAQKVIALNQFLNQKEAGELREYVLKIENWRSEEKKELFIAYQFKENMRNYLMLKLDYV